MIPIADRIGPQFIECRSCHVRHDRLTDCGMVRRWLAGHPAEPSIQKPAVVIKPRKVVNKPEKVAIAGSQQASVVVIEPKPAVVNNRHGKYADQDKRRAYQVEWMRRKRSASKAGAPVA